GREERRAPLAPQHPDEARMEIGAVSPLVLTGPDGVTAAPPGSALVIAHRAVDVVVAGPYLGGAGLAPAACPLGELANDAREWDQLVGRLVEHRAQVGVGRRRARGYPRRGTTLDDEPHDQVSDHAVGLALNVDHSVPILVRTREPPRPGRIDAGVEDPLTARLGRIGHPAGDLV